MKEISLEEKRQIQLDMLKEIDEFCRNNGIRYSLAFGTLIGAIRHKGFIPWDDDVDIMMPISDMMKFKKMFVSKTMKYADIETYKHFQYCFSRLHDTRTFSKLGRFNKDMGVNIDLYVMVDLPKDKKSEDKFFEEARKYEKICDFFMKWNSRFIRRFPLKSIPFTDYYIRKERECLIKSLNYGDTGNFYCISGPLSGRYKESYNRDLFKEMIDVDFEGLKLMSVKDYDYFLRQEYGDYMQLPPEDQRVPYHGGHYYWK